MIEDSADIIVRQILRRRTPRIAGSSGRKRSEAEIDEISARTVEMIGFFRTEIYDQVIIERDECGEIVGTNNPKYARGQVLIKLDAAHLQDEILNEEEFEVFFWKPFAEWPEYLQARLQPFGAEMIQKAEDPNAQFKESAPSRKAIVMQPWSYPDGEGNQLLLKLEEAATKGLVWRNSPKDEELQTALQPMSPARSFLAEAHHAGMPLSVSEAIFLAGIQSPADGIERIPKELMERLQKHGVANCTHQPSQDRGSMQAVLARQLSVRVLSRSGEPRSSTGLVENAAMNSSLSADKRMQQPPTEKEGQLMRSEWPYQDMSDEERLATMRIPWNQLPENLVERLLNHAVVPPVDPEEPIIRVWKDPELAHWEPQNSSPSTSIPHLENFSGWENKAEQVAEEMAGAQLNNSEDPELKPPLQPSQVAYLMRTPAKNWPKEVQELLAEWIESGRFDMETAATPEARGRIKAGKPA